MPILATHDATRNSTGVVGFPGVRIERERDGEGWLVLTPHGRGWLHGDRPSALREMRWHRRNERGRA